VKLWTDEEAAAVPAVKAVFDDIRATRKSDFVNNFWRALANQPLLFERTWASVKAVMVEPGALDPLTKELVYVAVSTTNGCSYCVHSHTVAARAKGLSDQQYAEFLAVLGMAAETNTLATSLQIPVDREFLIG
jgi:AhpD family alkylhydroperoxidase